LINCDAKVNGEENPISYLNCDILGAFYIFTDWNTVNYSLSLNSGGGDALLYGVGVERSTTHRRLRQNSATFGNTRQQVRWQVSTVDCWRT